MLYWASKLAFSKFVWNLKVECWECCWLTDQVLLLTFGIKIIFSLSNHRKFSTFTMTNLVECKWIVWELKSHLIVSKLWNAIFCLESKCRIFFTKICSQSTKKFHWKPIPGFHIRFHRFNYNDQTLELFENRKFYCIVTSFININFIFVR